MSKNKNMYGVAHELIHKNRNQHTQRNNSCIKSWIHSRLMNFLAFSKTGKPKLAFLTQIFVCLSILMVATNAWAVPTVDLSVVDTEGDDSVFNGTTQKLRITVSVSEDINDLGPYNYVLKVDGYDTNIDQGTISENETKTPITDWNGSVGGAKLLDGTYTLRVEIRQQAANQDEEPLTSDEVSVTLDGTPPEVSISTDITEFSPNGDRILDVIAVFYNISEDVAESELQFFRGNSQTQFGRPIRLDETEGGHTFFWDGSDRNFRTFPDGQYRLSIKVIDEAGNTRESDKTDPLTIDTQPPIISKVEIPGAETDEGLTLLDGIFINMPLQLIRATANAAGGTPIDFTDPDTSIVLENQEGTTIAGSLSNDQTSLTLSLGDRLDTASENGEYTLSVAVADRAGNLAEKTLNFTFDNVAPNLAEVATSNGAFTPGGGVSTWTNFVEATLSDNLQNGLSLSDSTIRLTGPDGPVLGRQTQPTADKIRWVFLSPLTAQDGLMDGVYTVEVNAVDKAGNQTGALQIPFIYDNLPPLVTLGSAEESPFTLHLDTIYHAQPLLQIVATFDDAGVGVNLQENTRVVFGTRGAGGGLNALPGRVVLAKDRDQLTYVLETPLTSRDGSQDGRYVLNVQATDTLGNTETYNYNLVYDTQIPTLVSTVPAANQTVSELSEVRVVLDETTSGIDFIQSTFQLTREVNGAAVDVPVNLTSNGTDAAVLTLAQPIALDGSDDGTYTVEISPMDLAGNVGVTVRREFYLVSQIRPEIRLTMPETTVVNDLTTVTAELSGYIGAGIDFGASTLTVRNAQDTLISQDEPEHDSINNLLMWNIENALPRDGSADGEYTITATFVDFTGRRFTQQFQRLYDTQIPVVESVRIATDSQPELSTDSTTTVAEDFSQVTITFEDTPERTVSGIDFANTGVTLTNPAGENIAVNSFDDGGNVLTLAFQALTQRGEYVLTITPQDLAGNQSAVPLVYRFRVGGLLPTVTSVLIGGKFGVIVYVNGDASDIVATFADLSGAGLDLDDGGSTIAVTSAEGLPIPGITTSNGIDQLTWIPIVLPTNGSADGSYTVVVTPKDKAGRQGDVTYRQFVYDTQKPRITAATPVALNQPATYIGSLTQLQFTVEDVGPAGLELADQTIELLDPQGAIVNATFTFDEINSHLYLTLDAPLAQDGSVDGTYTVKVSLVDKAGNILEAAQTFVYDSQVPQLAAISVNTEVPMELVPQEIAEVAESISSITLQFEEATRVDFANTVVSLVGPNGQPIPINISADGLTQLTARFVALTQAGLYTLSVTPQDIAGNVAQGALQYAFRLDFVLPSVSVVELGGQIGDVVFLNGGNTTIVATLIDGTGSGLALGDGGSSIVVTGPSGAVVPGQTRTIGTNQLGWQPISLPTDGSVDGRYTVTITPIDQVGRQGDVVHREFIYDTEEPRITASSPLTLSQPMSYIPGGLNQFSFTVEDVGPADLLLEAQTIELIDSSGSALPATLTYDELTNQLYLTLSSPFARDGSVDGAYTMRVSLVDRAGNVLNVEHALIYDSQAPQLALVVADTETPVELIPQGSAEISEPVSSITLHFDEATRVDFNNTVVTLVSSGVSATTGDPEVVDIPLTLQDNGTSQITVSFAELNQLDTYILSVTPQDIAGNVSPAPTDYTFTLDIPLPIVSSVIIGDIETAAGGDVVYINASNTIIGAVLEDPSETGLDFSNEGSDITVADTDNLIVRGVTGSNGVDLLIWEPATFTTDGTTDGRYGVYVTPVDKAGREGNTVYREFIYDTQEPEISDAEPIDLSQPVSYISESLRQFRFTVADVGPADLVLADQNVSLRDASGNLVPARLTNDTGNQVFLTLDQPLPRDGSMDGEYTVVIAFADRAGNARNIEHTLIYDTQSPTVVSTVPADGALLTEDITQIQVTLNDEGGSEIDWSMTTITLVNPSGQEIPGELVNNGTTTLTLSTNQLVEDGRYIVRIHAIDRAGNGGVTSIERSFVLSRYLPTITSTEPRTAPADEAFTNEEIEQIEVNLETDDANHLSTLRLLNPANQVVAGQQERASGRLIYNLVRPLATDGSEDGIYTIEFTPISASGRSGEVQRLTFTYDTQAPEIESDDAIQFVVAAAAGNNSLTEIRATLTDDTSGIDWENLDDAWITFEQVSPNRTKVSGHISEDTQGTLTFLLTVPLADNGSADGEYELTINPVDRAGNDDEPYERVFVYDTSPPMIDVSTLLINEVPLIVDIDAENYPSAVSATGGVVIQASIFDTGLGVDLTQSQITVRGPDGSEVTGSTQQNGVDTIVFKSGGLTLQGHYQVTVTGVGNDSERLGFAPIDSVTTRFLYETDEPTAAVTSDGGETELTDEPILFEGTASDPEGTQRIGDGEITVPPSGVWLVEIVGIGPDDQPIDPVPAVDDSGAQEEPWSRWSIDFLPSRSGEYELDVRVTDNAGNYAVYDIGTYTMSVSLTFRGSTFGWPNPLRLSNRDVAFFSYDVNVPLGETINLTLSIYDWSGDMVRTEEYSNVVSGQRNDQLVKWNLENQAGTPVARGLYIFRLEAVNAAGNSANVVGKVLVVD